MSNELKILQVVQYFPPAYAYGGPVKLVYEISKELTKQGHKITVLTTDVLDKNDRSHLPFNEKIQGIDIYRIKNISNYLASHRNFYFSFELKKFLNLNHNFDIVHYHDFRSLNNYFLSYHYKRKNIRQCMSPYGSMNNLQHKIEKKIFDYLLGNQIKQNIDLFFAVNEIEKEYIKDVTHSNNVVILQNSIDTEQIKLRDNFDIRKHFNLPRDKKILLFFSRLNHMKNPTFAIEVYNCLPRKLQSEMILILAGPPDGAENECIKLVKKLKLEDNVFILPRLIEDEKWNLYKESSLLILPTTDQAFPLVMLEALSMNLPVVTTEKALEKTWENDFGAIVNFDVNSFVKEIVNITQNNIKPINGREFVSKNYSIKQYCEKLEKYYRKLLK